MTQSSTYVEDLASQIMAILICMWYDIISYLRPKHLPSYTMVILKCVCGMTQFLICLQEI